MFGWLSAAARQDHFDRHDPVQLALACFEDDPHASLGDRLDHLVFAERRTGVNARWSRRHDNWRRIGIGRQRGGRLSLLTGFG